METTEKKKESLKRPKSWEELNAQGRFSLPDLLQWYGFKRRTWDRKWKRIFPRPALRLGDKNLWTREQLAEFEAQHQAPVNVRAGV